MKFGTTYLFMLIPLMLFFISAGCPTGHPVGKLVMASTAAGGNKALELDGIQYAYWRNDSKKSIIEMGIVLKNSSSEPIVLSRTSSIKLASSLIGDTLIPFYCILEKDAGKENGKSRSSAPDLIHLAPSSAELVSVSFGHKFIPIFDSLARLTILISSVDSSTLLTTTFRTTPDTGFLQLMGLYTPPKKAR